MRTTCVHIYIYIYKVQQLQEVLVSHMLHLWPGTAGAALPTAILDLSIHSLETEIHPDEKSDT